VQFNVSYKVYNNTLKVSLAVGAVSNCVNTCS